VTEVTVCESSFDRVPAASGLPLPTDVSRPPGMSERCHERTATGSLSLDLTSAQTAAQAILRFEDGDFAAWPSSYSD
jgi:hypothetical protein